MKSTELLARWRAKEKRKRDARLAFARARVDNHREKHPLAQGQLELDDEYLSKREHELRVMRQLQLEQAARRAAAIEAAHVTACPPPEKSSGSRWLAAPTSWSVNEAA
jgi:hypothetical protein